MTDHLPVLDVLDRRECLHLLATQSVGRLAVATPEGPLVVPVNFVLDGESIVFRSDRGSKLFADHTPRADATAVTRLKDAGAIILGKTNMPEFALWWESDNLVFGRTLNPWNAERIPSPIQYIGKTCATAWTQPHSAWIG